MWRNKWNLAGLLHTWEMQMAPRKWLDCWGNFLDGLANFICHQFQDKGQETGSWDVDGSGKPGAHGHQAFYPRSQQELLKYDVIILRPSKATVVRHSNMDCTKRKSSCCAVQVNSFGLQWHGSLSFSPLSIQFLWGNARTEINTTTSLKKLLIWCEKPAHPQTIPRRWTKCERQTGRAELLSQSRTPQPYRRSHRQW